MGPKVQMARSRVPVAKVQLKSTAHKAVVHVETAVECPLCIETLDDTDRNFFPCSCGYQVCLFCYQRLQNEYNNTCPGCRQQYGDDLDAVRQHIERKHKQQQQQQQQEVTVAARTAASSLAAHGHAGHGHGHHSHAHAQHHASHIAHGAHAGTHGGLAATPGSSAAAATAKQRHAQQYEPAAPAAEGGAASHSSASLIEAAGSNSPAPASWVSAAAHSNGASAHVSSFDLPVSDLPPPPTTVDESAWPTLGVAANSTSSSQQQHKENGLQRRHSSSSSLLSLSHQQPGQQQHSQQTIPGRQDTARSSLESNSSALASDQDEQQQQQQQQHVQLDRRTSSGFTSVEVTTVVAGSRHSVCVPVQNHSEVAPFPEAATLLEMLQSAVNGSKLSSTEAAVQLVQCLRKLEADSQHKQQQAWLQQALANGNQALSGRPAGTRHTSSAGGRPPAAPGAAARAPPPGFSGAVHHSKLSAYAPHLQQQEVAAARGTPYRPGGVTQPSLQQQSQQQSLLLQQQASASENYASQSSMHSVDSNSSLFSQGSALSQSAGLWTDSGLPGVDFAGVGGLGGGIPAAVPARLQMLWAGGNGQQGSTQAAAAAPAASAVSMSGFGSSVNPPPGFGGLAGSRLVNGAYNPLSFADAGAAVGKGAFAAGSAPPGFNFGGVDAGAKPPLPQQPIYRPWA